MYGNKKACKGLRNPHLKYWRSFEYKLLWQTERTKTIYLHPHTNKLPSTDMHWPPISHSLKFIFQYETKVWPSAILYANVIIHEFFKTSWGSKRDIISWDFNVFSFDHGGHLNLIIPTNIFKTLQNYYG